MSWVARDSNSQSVQTVAKAVAARESAGTFTAPRGDVLCWPAPRRCSPVMREASYDSPSTVRSTPRRRETRPGREDGVWWSSSYSPSWRAFYLHDSLLGAWKSRPRWYAQLLAQRGHAGAPRCRPWPQTAHSDGHPSRGMAGTRSVPTTRPRCFACRGPRAHDREVVEAEAASRGAPFATRQPARGSVDPRHYTPLNGHVRGTAVRVERLPGYNLGLGWVLWVSGCCVCVGRLSWRLPWPRPWPEESACYAPTRLKVRAWSRTSPSEIRVLPGSTLPSAIATGWGIYQSTSLLLIIQTSGILQPRGVTNH